MLSCYTQTEPITYAATLCKDYVLLCKGHSGPGFGQQLPSISHAAERGLELTEAERQVPHQREPPELEVPAPAVGNPADLEEGNLLLGLIYAPQYIPDVVVQAVQLPCSVNHAIASFSRRREATQASCFDQLFPVSPQPDRRMATFVAFPSWVNDKVVVLFNCLAVNRTLFAAEVFPSLNKASILRVAGFDDPQNYEIYIHGLLQPVLPDVWIALRSGMTLCVTPAGQGPLQSWNLEDMLQDPNEWDYEAPIPGPPPPAGEHLWILSEGMPTLFRIRADRRRQVTEDIVDMLQFQMHRTTVKTTRPRVIDHMGRGFPTWAVIVATEQLQTLPYPPARHPETRIIVVLDCRAILQGFKWHLLSEPRVLINDLADMFADTCPAAHLVAIKGADIIRGDNGLEAAVQHGQVLKIEFVEEADTNPSASSEDADMQHASDDHLSIASGQPGAIEENLDPEADTHRSRSPRSEHAPSRLEASAGQCSFGILAPGFQIEQVTVDLPAVPTTHQVVHTLQIARDDALALAFPLLCPLNKQPQLGSGLLVATPIWSYDGIFICIDMSIYWGRIFATLGKSEMHRHQILAVAGLAEAADVDVYVNGLPPSTDPVRLREGDCITIVWTGSATPTVVDFRDTFEGSRNIIPLDTGEIEDDHYCIVSPDGCRLFTLQPQRSYFYRADIASRINCHPNEMLLVPGVPQPGDVSFLGHPCRAVTAAMRVGHMPLQVQPCVGILDARRVLLDWQPVLTQDGWLHIADATTRLGVNLPVGWEARIEGTTREQEWIHYSHGAILVVVSHPSNAAIGTGPGTQDPVAQPSDDNATETGQASPPSVAPAKPTTSGTSREPNAASPRVEAASLSLCERASLVSGGLALRRVESKGSQTKQTKAVVRGGSNHQRTIKLLLAFQISTASKAMYAESQGVIQGVSRPCSRAGRVDMWAKGYKANARDAGHPQLTPILPVSKAHQPHSGDEKSAPFPRSMLFRAIATPCRHRPPPTTGSACLCSPSADPASQTLLQEVFRCQGDRLYETAYDLLEKLRLERGGRGLLRARHCGGNAPGNPPVPGQARQILIDNMLQLPVSAVQHSVATTAEPVMIGDTPASFSWNDLIRLLNFRFTLHPWNAFFGLNHPFTKRLSDAIAQRVAQTHQHALCCYTDGSFYPAQQGKPARLGWAVLFFNPDGDTVGWLAGPIPTWAQNSDSPSAYLAECFALIVAHFCAALNYPSTAITFRSDCQAALGVAKGTMSFRDGKIPQALANVASFRRSRTPGLDVIEYVPGHSGEFFNDVVDELAKWGAQQPIYQEDSRQPDIMRNWLDEGAVRLPWAAIVLQRASGQSQMPPTSQLLGQDNMHAGLSMKDLVAPFIPEGAEAETPYASHLNDSAQLAFAMLSYNTLTLGAHLEDSEGKGMGGLGLQFRPGRAALLAEQLDNLGISIAALQETRGPEGQTHIGKYLRYASGAEQGCFGTEVWLHTEIPFIIPQQQGATKIFFAAKHTTVVHKDPRRLLLRCTAQSWKLLIASLHAPHRGTENHILAEWWTHTRTIVHRYSQSAFVFLAGDVNASVGSILSPHVGGVAAEEEDMPGTAWHGLIKEVECFLPCTFDQHQQGPTATYVQKRNGHECRPDMIAIPCAWQNGDISAWTAPEIHTALSCQDHTATCVRLSVALLGHKLSQRSHRKRISAESILDPQNEKAILKALQTLPTVPWEVSSHAHSAIVVRHLQDHLHDVVHQAPARPKHAYITEPTWELQRTTTAWKRSLQRLQLQKRSQICAILFDAWRGRYTSTEGESPLRCNWMLRAALSEILHRYHISRYCRRLRQACRIDRDAYVSDLAQKVGHNPNPEVFGALHRLLCHKRKKPYAPEPLPMVLDDQGDPCQDAEAMMQRWRQHFGAMEGGTESSFPDLAVDILEQQRSQMPWPAPALLEQLPSTTDLQRVMLNTKLGKAPGPDGIPGALLKRFAAQLAPALHPLLLKLALRGSESLGFKGGIAVKFWKGKGSKQEAANYRQILLVSNLAKCIHQALRPALRELFVAQAPSLQIGGRPGSNVVYGAHLTRSFLRWQAQNHRPCFLLFTDIASAFYSVVRELVAKRSSDGRQPTSLLGIELPPEDLELLLQHTTDASALQAAGATPWLEALAQRLTEATWFVLQNDNCPIITSRGTRPGSSWADLLFSFVVRRILQKRDEMMKGSNVPVHPPAIPADSARTLIPCSPTSETHVLDDLIWADDIATMRVVPTSAALLQGVKVTVGTSCDAFAEHGFRLSYGRNKTAAIVQPAGQGAREARRQLFGVRGLKGTVTALREHSAPAKIPLVTDYKHLGSQIAVQGGMRAEIAYRVSQARAAYQESRRKVYKARGIPVARKAYILRSMTLPKLLYGCGSWPPLSDKEFRIFAGTLWHMYRQILCVPHHADQHLSAATVLTLTGLPGPAVTLHVHRMLYLSQLVRTGPDELWTLLRLDRPYADIMAGSARWLHRWLYGTSPLPDPDTSWQQWVEIMLGERNKFKGWILRAQALEQCKAHVIAALDGVYRAIKNLVPSKPDVQSCRWEEVCIPCKKLFQSRVAWSCHAQRIHGYRTSAYKLCATVARPLCQGCGKTYGSMGRLRCHLGYSAACRDNWGVFHPAPGTEESQHPQAPPGQAQGTFDPLRVTDTRVDVSHELLEQLQAISHTEETSLWEVVSAHIAPIAVLRNTVREWRNSLPPHADSDTADNLLLLLDPDLLGEIPVLAPPKLPCPADAAPEWRDITPIRYAVTGRQQATRLQPPPKVLLSPTGYTSIRLRQAMDYATWLEAACAKIAQCLAGGDEAPSRILCEDLERSLGPAALWLKALGAVFTDDGLAFAQD